MIHKTKHRIDFCGNGISIAFVFCLVQTRTKFHPETNHWMWEFEHAKLKDKVRTCIDNSKSKYVVTKNVDNEQTKNIIRYMKT